MKFYSINELQLIRYISKDITINQWSLSWTWHYSFFRIPHWVEVFCFERSPLRDYAIILKISQKFLTKIFLSLIRSKNLNGFVCLFFYFISEFCKLFKSFSLVFHHIHIFIPWQIISKDDEVTITTPGLRIKWPTHISV